jgi:hypothetical protein
MITIQQITEFCKTHNAVDFHKWCDANKIYDVWLDVTLTNFNDGYYNVDLPAYGLNVCFYDGVLEEIADIEHLL